MKLLLRICSGVCVVLACLVGGGLAEARIVVAPEELETPHLTTGKPDLTIEAPEHGVIHDARLTDDATRIHVLTTVPAVNLWATAVYYWPELLSLVCAVIGLLFLRFAYRWLRERRAYRGGAEEVCASCGYDLRHLSRDVCPECGAALSDGGRRRAADMKMFWPRAVLPAVALLALALIWQDTPLRYGRVNEWFAWDSTRVARWMIAAGKEPWEYRELFSRQHTWSVYDASTGQLVGQPWTGRAKAGAGAKRVLISYMSSSWTHGNRSAFHQIGEAGGLEAVVYGLGRESGEAPARTVTLRDQSVVMGVWETWPTELYQVQSHNHPFNTDGVWISSSPAQIKTSWHLEGEPRLRLFYQIVLPPRQGTANATGAPRRDQFSPDVTIAAYDQKHDTWIDRRSITPDWSRRYHVHEASNRLLVVPESGMNIELYDFSEAVARQDHDTGSDE